jgi:hypothetical protein
MNSQAALGFSYRLRITHTDGRVEESVDHNLIPIEGLNHMMSVTFKGATAVPTWYLALFEGNYTPTTNDTAATFAANATECVAYTPTTRPEFVEGNVAGGAVDNSAALAVFTFTAAKTIYGGAMLSSSVKGGTTGVLVSIARFASPKVMESGAKLEVLAGNTLVSV